MLEDPKVWDDNKKSQELGKEKRALELVVNSLQSVESTLNDSRELFEMARDENDDETLLSVDIDSQAIEKQVAEMEFRRMFSGELDVNNCFIEFQSGSGGTEAQDWAAMLLRMYLRYCERKGFKVEVLEESDGDVAGIKGASIKVTGDYAYGTLRTENGVHRLVRKSPFDSNAKRHTSFASVQIFPEVDDSIQIDINPADLRIDTYRASGAGGQHINKTDSAVRMTHIPTGTVAQCQNQRSQIKNREQCMKMLRARLFELERQKHADFKTELGGDYQAIEWGSQIRSYVFHPYNLVKDHRTNNETGNVNAVMDGELTSFIEAFLKQEK